jgi:hypothetical protein
MGREEEEEVAPMPEEVDEGLDYKLAEDTRVVVSEGSMAAPLLCKRIAEMDGSEDPQLLPEWLLHTLERGYPANDRGEQLRSCTHLTYPLAFLARTQWACSICHQRAHTHTMSGEGCVKREAAPHRLCRERERVHRGAVAGAASVRRVKEGGACSEAVAQSAPSLPLSLPPSLPSNRIPPLPPPPAAHLLSPHGFR